VSEPRSALAHAKINLVLEVLGVRDDGYHEIDTILQEVELADVVAVAPASDWAIDVTGPRAAGTPEDHSNLALRAAILLAERVEDSCPVRISLEKHVPAAGGLGGGASDAATALKLLAELWPRATWPDLQAVANAIGSDEAFFLVGGTARAAGRGERVTPLPSLPAHDVVLFVPRQTVERKTPRMFAALDRHAFDGRLLAELFQADHRQTVTMEATFNAFERVAFDLFPWLADLWADLERRTGEAIRLAGAGPCMFWVGPAGGERVASSARGADCEIILTRTVTR
jgi:4-diphosphocytidyl-2-C-methyl-D-erythritol kinase